MLVSLDIKGVCREVEMQYIQQLCFVMSNVLFGYRLNGIFSFNAIGYSAFVKKCTGPEHMIFQFKLRTIFFAFLFERELLKF